jgi:hypothetical protein
MGFALESRGGEFDRSFRNDRYSDRSREHSFQGGRLDPEEASRAAARDTDAMQRAFQALRTADPLNEERPPLAAKLGGPIPRALRWRKTPAIIQRQALPDSVPDLPAFRFPPPEIQSAIAFIQKGEAGPEDFVALQDWDLRLRTAVAERNRVSLRDAHTSRTYIRDYTAILGRLFGTNEFEARAELMRGGSWIAYRRFFESLIGADDEDRFDRASKALTDRSPIYMLGYLKVESNPELRGALSSLWARGLVRSALTMRGRVVRIAPSQSPVWRELKRYRGKIRYSGEGRDRLYYEWDKRHGEIEVYNSRGEHIYVIEPMRGRQIKDYVPGRRIDL